MSWKEFLENSLFLYYEKKMPIRHLSYDKLQEFALGEVKRMEKEISEDVKLGVLENDYLIAKLKGKLEVWKELAGVE